MNMKTDRRLPRYRGPTNRGERIARTIAEWISARSPRTRIVMGAIFFFGLIALGAWHVWTDIQEKGIVKALMFLGLAVLVTTLRLKESFRIKRKRVGD